jgi:hypothetical protein
MKEIRLTRSFLSKPMNSLFILLFIYMLIEAVSWSVAYPLKIVQLNKSGGFIPYMGLAVRNMLLPELCTLYIILFLINRFHDWFKLSSVENSWQAIGRYQLRFLPVLGLAFWLFNPVTQSVRFLTSQFPTYSFNDYWQNYILNTLTLGFYLKYLFPVLLIGYIALNISLLTDYLKQRREAQESAEAQAAKSAQEALALSVTFTPKPTVPSSYLSYLKGKNTYGELDFPVNDVYYFTIEDRFYYAELTKGRYLVGKTLNDLEAELDPSQFFRIKRDYIVNRQAVLNYAYWENGKYIVRLNTPERYEIIVPRARMQEFREWLQGNQQPYADTDSDSFILAS